ncbi:8062_t:CDS:2, partial [Racocetra fulgida]
VGVNWFYIIYELFLITAIVVAIGSNALSYYRTAVSFKLKADLEFYIVTFLGIGIVFHIPIINSFISLPLPALQAFAAGALFVTIFAWVIAFGAEDGSLVGDTINSWSINKPAHPRNVHPDVGFPSGVQLNPGQIQMTTMQDQVVVSPNADYAYKAKALYDCNPEDQTELSFTKGEILDIVDNKGKWWQAKKADGSIGIAPSNYVSFFY